MLIVTITATAFDCNCHIASVDQVTKCRQQQLQQWRSKPDSNTTYRFHLPSLQIGLSHDSHTHTAGLLKATQEKIGLTTVMKDE